MRITTYNVYDRRIVWAEGTSIIGNENVDKFHFEFDPEWDEFEAKFMVLIVDGTSYIDQLDAENNVTLRNVVYDKENVEFGVYGIDTSNDAKLSTNIIGIETTESIWGRIREISDLPSKTQWEIYTEEMLALLAQGSITLEECQQALTDTLSAKNTTKGYMDTTEGFKNTTKGYMDTTEGYKQDVAGLKQDTINIVTEFNSNVEQKTTDFNSNASSKTTAFNNNASSKLNDFNSNYTDKLGTFNSNATSKTTDFNDNASSKTTTFNSNASSKTTTFNNNASSKTDDYNSNATSKTTAFNENYTEKYNAVTLAGTTAVGNVQTAEQTAITNIETAGSSYDARINELLDQIPVGTVEDTYINLQDSSDLLLKDFVLCGNTYQLQTDSGKNLLDTSVWIPGYIDNSGVYHSETNNINTTFDNFISVSASSAYTISANKNVRNISFCEYNSSQEFIQKTQSNNNVSSLTVTTTANTAYVKICFNYDNSSRVSQGIIDSIELQFEAGSERTLYVPYSGGHAVPTPSYPSPINVVTGDITVTLMNKNLLNARTDNDIRSSTATNLTLDITGNKITVTNGNENNTRAIGWAVRVGTERDVTISYDALTINTGSQGEVRCFFDSSIPSSFGPSAGVVINNTNKYVTLTPTDEYLVVLIRCGQSGSVSVDNLMVSHQTDKVFVSHEEQTQLLSLGNIELAKIGNYQDYLWHDEESGKWYKHNVIAKMTLTGSQSEIWNNMGWQDGKNAFRTTAQGIIVLPLGTEEPVTMSNYYMAYSTNTLSNTAATFYGIANRKNTEEIIIRNDNYSTVTTFREWLSSNNTTVYYVLATPTDTEITDTILIEQLDALYDLQTYKNVTNIFTVTDNEEPILNVTYRKDLQTMFNNLTNAIVSLGNNI